VLYASTHKVAGNPTRANSFTPRSSVLFGALSWIEVPQVVSDGRISYRPLLVRTFAKQLCGVRRVRPECNAWILAMAGSLRLEYQGRPFHHPDYAQLTGPTECEVLRGKPQWQSQLDKTPSCGGHACGRKYI